LSKWPRKSEEGHRPFFGLCGKADAIFVRGGLSAAYSCSSIHLTGGFQSMAQRSKGKKRGERREAGTAGSSIVPETTTVPPDPQKLERKMTPDEKVGEASLESMDASDPPARSSTGSGAPAVPRQKQGSATLEERIRRRAYEMWEQEGRQSGRDDQYWHRAEQELSCEAEQSSKPER
jgi:Protein of unknown function (DUF2934)